jgi:hypothetical protein
MTLAPHKCHKCETDKQRQAEQNDVDRYRVVLKGLVRSSIKGRLREVKDTGKADDEAVDFAEGGEAEDLGGIIAGIGVSRKLKCGGGKTYETAV